MLNLPTTPGVYLMKDDLDEVIYVGKAKNLKNRVSQYFQKNKNHSAKTIKMVSNIASYEYIVTNTEVEALILECNLIKKYSPKYNIRLKDDKRYPYIKINIKSPFPQIQVVRKIIKDDAKYFGPYTDATSMWEMIELIKQFWQLRSCNKKLPKDIGKNRECLNFHIGRCSGPCIKNITAREYHKIVDEIVEFLSGDYRKVVTELKQRMSEASDAMNFELAATLRDQLIAIAKLEQKQTVDTASKDNQDIVAYAEGTNDALIQVYFVRSGKLVGREHFILRDATGDEAKTLFRNFILQFYAEATFVPREIVVQVIPAEVELLENYLSDKRGARVVITSPKKGTKFNLLELAKKNAELTFFEQGDQLKKKLENTKLALSQLQEALNLEKPIIRIEAFDISNTSGVYPVGAMVVFENGVPKKSDYRKFKIKTVRGQNDYAAMEEMLSRRYKNAEEGKVPDMIFMDGGKSQVAAAKKVLVKYNLEILVCGMVKDEKHRTFGLLYEDNEIVLPKFSKLFKLVTRIQDEVHRFAIEYHRKLRGNIHSVLDEIKGVGPVRKKILLLNFKSVYNLKEASLEELEQYIPKDVAKNVYTYFNSIRGDKHDIKK
ncbi:excinuclease ABC subunit UvrC [Candidatus Epulonipiscium viviparus]|uniref:excinuclease ABC subunit UvrC n=1 Tax=Candidatus Epulonipiscium viviparus TaxID=420336 RepID=UPI0027381455|nr:excinuclease ABC subunit UvrC [Candidatus Epulopiscium viviparus]